MKESTKFILLIAVFLGAYFTPWEEPIIRQASLEAFLMLREYTREHTLTCLIPAFFIAGAISVFISRAAVLKYFGAGARKIMAYSVASISGTILAVCSCTVLPLFAGIYTRGAGIGPATAFLYSGPAINILSIVLTARVLGWQLGLARMVCAVLFAIIIGLLMAFIFRKEDAVRQTGEFHFPDDGDERTLSQNAFFLALLVFILIFATFARPAAEANIIWQTLFTWKWGMTLGLLVLLGLILKSWFKKDEILDWLDATWGFMKQIFPLLFIGVIAAGFLLGRPDHTALIPEKYIANLVGGNSLAANFFASLAGSLMYFATLTEIPILQGLLGSGMGQGPALALLLAGPSLSLPNMIVISGVLGVRKTAIFVLTVIVMSTLAGVFYGSFF